MAEPTGHPCPECGTPREPDNTPACACAQRAADALRDARTAQAAAAEDFDPLRIRPYVELDGTTAPRTTAEAPTRELPTAGGQVPPAGAAVTPGTASTARGTPDATWALTPPTGAPGETGPRPFEAADVTGTRPDGNNGDGVRPRRRRRTVLLAAAGSVVAVAAAAGYASGMFSYDTPSRNAAIPSGLRASVPDAPAEEVAPSTGASPSTSRAPAPPGPPTDASTSPSASPSRSSTSPRPSQQPAEPSAPPATAAATGTPATGHDDGRGDGTVLRRGDRGPEVAELQLRLRQLYLYAGDADGHFTRPLEYALRTYQWSRDVGTDDDELGVYGPDTRRSLESETREP